MWIKHKNRLFCSSKLYLNISFSRQSLKILNFKSLWEVLSKDEVDTEF